jgi:adenine phosphoribosyltransferase
VSKYKDKGITKVVGIESRGFLLDTSVALDLNAGVAICRKKGKLPGKVVEENFEKEYGRDTVCMTCDAITSDDVVLIHDDLLATGGSLKAAYNLVNRFHPKKIYINVIIELKGEGLNGRKLLEDIADVTALIQV